MDELDPKDLDSEHEEDVDDGIIAGKGNKENPDEDSLDALAEEEDGILPEDSFDDQDKDW